LALRRWEERADQMLVTGGKQNLIWSCIYRTNMLSGYIPSRAINKYKVTAELFKGHHRGEGQTVLQRYITKSTRFRNLRLGDMIETRCRHIQAGKESKKSRTKIPIRRSHLTSIPEFGDRVSQ
jgi:hypothetical protein